MSDLLNDLQWRGLVAQTTDAEELAKALDGDAITFYCGFDPTAPSLHIGNLVQLLVMRHLQRAGHRPICLVGGATGLIGDPKPTAERNLNDPETVSGWVQRLTEQVRPFFSFEGTNAAVVVNNLDWTQQLTAIEWLRDIGQHFRVNQMVKKDAVSARLNSDQGISYTEFSYQMLQGYDFLHLFREFGCVLQTCGQDQWGNATAGTDLLHRVEATSGHVLTVPLITTADGTKFGKSEGNAIWLDPELTSPYAFYQFWINVEDAKVLDYLKVFTDITAEELAELEQSLAEKPGLRAPHRRLAQDVTTLIHGAQACAGVEDASQALFGRGDLAELDAMTLRDALAPLPGATFSRDGATIIDLLTDTGLVQGRKAARRTVGEGGAYVNNVKIEDPEQTLGTADLLHDRWLVVRRGKKVLARAELVD